MARHKRRKGRNYFSATNPVTDEQLREYAWLARVVALKMLKSLPDSVDRDEVMQFALIGLVDAIQRFNPDDGAQFNTYATARIRGAIIDNLRHEAKVPRQAFQNAMVIRRFKTEHGYHPSFKELKSLKGWTAGRAASAYAAYGVLAPISLDTASDMSADQADQLQVPGPWQYEPDSFTELQTPKWMSAVTKELESRLEDPRLRAVVKLRLSGWSLHAIAGILDVCESRASQLLTRAGRIMGISMADIRGNNVKSRNPDIPPVLYVEGEINAAGYASLDE